MFLRRIQISAQDKTNERGFRQGILRDKRQTDPERTAVECLQSQDSYQSSVGILRAGKCRRSEGDQDYKSRPILEPFKLSCDPEMTDPISGNNSG